MSNTSTKKIVAISAGLIIIGGLGIAFAYKRAQMKRRRRKNISIQII